MKGFLRFATLLLILAALGGGGYYLYYDSNYQPPTTRRTPPPTTPQVEAPGPLPDLELAVDAFSPDGGAVATLVGFQRTVTTRRADELAWQGAESRMSLFNNDAVRTFDKSSATIAFGENDIIEIDQNALVIIKPRRTVGDETEITLALLSPDLLESLSAKPLEEQKKIIASEVKRRQVKIRTPTRTASKPGGKTRIAVRTLPDKSTTIAAVGGSLKLVGPKGDEVILKEKMVTKITPKGVMIKPRMLPPSPSLASPKNKETFTFLRKVPQVELKWRPAQRAVSYRVVVARDSRFRKIFADEKVRGTSFSIRNMEPGSYYWRVRSVDAEGFEGKYSIPWSIKTMRDARPPKLTILSPATEMFVSPGPTLALKGKTDSGVRVKVNGQRAVVGPDGSFACHLPLKAPAVREAG